MVSGLCHGHDTLGASKLHEAFTIICIRLPQDFVMDFELVARREAAQEIGTGPPLGQVPQGGFKTPSAALAKSHGGEGLR